MDFDSAGKRLATGSGEPSRSGEIKIWKAREIVDKVRRQARPAASRHLTPVDSEGYSAGGGKNAVIYRTCLCTLMLEVYYRYLPTGR